VTQRACRTNYKKMLEKIRNLDYHLPSKLSLSAEVADLLAQIFVKDPAKRATVAQIKAHAWFQERLPAELSDGYSGFARCVCLPAWPLLRLHQHCVLTYDLGHHQVSGVRAADQRHQAHR